SSRGAPAASARAPGGGISAWAWPSRWRRGGSSPAGSGSRSPGGCSSDLADAVDTLAAPATGFGVALAPHTPLFAFLGAALGTAVGVLPGIGPALTVALLLPATYQLA